ncbi:MAG: MBL fold metallo-hydrolase [Chloroflexi bacterium]|nr:MBL fold metallo-hydrolase [Chloroflexota bacterium]
MGVRGALDLTFIGSGNAFGDSRCYSGFVLNGRVLFDAPPTAVYSLKRARMPMEQIDVVLLSHFHADHFFGLPFLLLEYTFPGAAGGRTPNRARDLTIVGPPGVGDTVERLNELAFPTLLSRNPSYKRHYVEIEPGHEAEVAGLRIGAAKMNHAEGSLDLCLGYRVEVERRTIAYTGDTGWCDSLLELGRGADVYVTDCNYASGRNLPEHLSLDEVRDLRGMLDPRTRMILTHLGHDEAPRDLPNTRVASDLARFVFS